MTEFEVAKRFMMSFGKYRGKSLDEIAETDEGLKYLDWAAGEFQDGWALQAIKTYLADPSIQNELDRILKK